MIFYNIHVFEKYGVAIPDHQNITWDEFWALCDELAAKMPDGEYPLDLGDRKGWPACQVFENIMMGTDPQLYEDFINGTYDLDRVTEVLATYAKLMDYVAPDHSSRDWYEATGQVVAGTYAMQIMGAWAQPLMTSMGQVYGEDYGVFTFPGTDGWFGMCIDGFVVSNDSADVEAGLKWAYNVSTNEVQTAFSALKESVSPYSDTPDETYCPLTLEFKNEITSENTKVFCNRKSIEKPFIAVITCKDAEAEKRVQQYLNGQVKKAVVKSKSAQKGNIELSYEVSLKGDDTGFITTLSDMEGVNSAVLVSYNGDYMG